MFAGFLPPTSGTAVLDGYDITTDLEGAQACLSICPQHDVLYDILTVDQHIAFFAKVSV